MTTGKGKGRDPTDSNVRTLWLGKRENTNLRQYGTILVHVAFQSKETSQDLAASGLRGGGISDEEDSEFKSSSQRPDFASVESDYETKHCRRNQGVAQSRSGLEWRAQCAYPKTLFLPRDRLPFSLVAMQSRLKKLIAYRAEIFVADPKGNIPLRANDSGYDSAGLDYLIKTSKQYYDRCRQERTLKKSDMWRCAVSASQWSGRSTTKTYKSCTRKSTRSRFPATM